MVVGTGVYENLNEAYPLDKKTLNKVAFRSFLISAGKNAETGEANAWCWAMTPALKKIHENENDLALSMGHNLEYVESGSFFSTLTMGVVLSLEAQKADLETIRSVRTTVNMLANSLSHSLMNLLILSTLAVCCFSAAVSGNVIPVLIFVFAAILVTVILRFKLIHIGYNQGTKILEKAIKQKEALKHASQIMGVFTIGAMIVISTMYASISTSFLNCVQISSAQSITTTIFNIIPGIFGICMTYLLYVLLTKKNWSILKCVLLVVFVGLLIGYVGFVVYTGTLTA